MNAIKFDGQESTVLDYFARLLLHHKSDIGMDDINDAELLQQASAILGSLVRISLNALRDPEEPDNARRLAALGWFVDWASTNIEGFPAAALEENWLLGPQVATGRRRAPAESSRTKRS